MNEENIILAIETSCDETAAAVIKNGTEILSNIVSTQIDSHKRFGGVVPEIASRHHVQQITIVLEEAFEQAKVTWDEIDAIAVTEGPGLVGALLIGVNAAKALAFVKEKPLIGVHHIAGHIYANRLQQEFEFPLLALIVSGGHTELVLMKEHGTYELIGETLDDAAGEAFDKVARTLRLPYPGGPHIDRLAHEGIAHIPFPRAWLEKGSYDFSFSGLKSAVINYVHNVQQRGDKVIVEDVAASFQASVVEVLTEKTFRAAIENGVNQVIVAGGVAANKGLRTSLKDRFQETKIPLFIPPIHLCTDNAAMIGAAASILFNEQKFSQWDLNGKPSLLLT
ncbi:tRNA (adenosine(37)-N6)-threonylcarbamoyltransferase complex transferase subunit TsaD [Pseudogracilibacillus auburnensis]|uniref:tRNA N6-adenosine threonylcarbamoyltransferase n=1 Tax=Pseudogracilibacillus auburnensis TaxID=1494959 RepID=A0A2V3W461_9BACI|nr:tRNA (adenosine(37)-N6)-threonylcarbamoyltransferase complex transferase subunit TsaD [Pseudogracilibacillus auburnensis]MBO1002748.1 tRNA (adenosine(37)-N6)-threonylcarbamoyltransferase complex transferase subunit TsaD [Pseudogracilibacillus auburnensis]PXW87861.1 O-sialoglycoprotein endopeptidase [Pseudogracilibacillus auburnensis]